jgi:hypothetical protein
MVVPSPTMIRAPSNAVTPPCAKPVVGTDIPATTAAAVTAATVNIFTLRIGSSTVK